MKAWLLLSILSYLLFAVSTSLDKYLMNYRFNILRTDTFKMFWDCVVLFIVGLVFFKLTFFLSLVLWSFLLGLFLIATLFLKEKLKWHKVIETIIIVAGVYLVT